MRGQSSYHFPLPVQRALRKLGSDIRHARLRRRIPAAVLAERASTTRATLLKIEKGDTGVSIGIVAKVLFALGLVDGLGQVADVMNDEEGLAFETERLPKRVRIKERSPTQPKGGSGGQGN